MAFPHPTFNKNYILFNLLKVFFSASILPSPAKKVLTKFNLVRTFFAASSPETFCP